VRPEEHTVSQLELAGWPVTLETYKRGETYYCTIANVDPGARIARAEGASRDEAERTVIEKATRYLSQTRRFAASS